MTDTIPRHSLVAEACVLAAPFLDPHLFPAILTVVKPEMFYRPAFGQWWTWLTEMHREGLPIEAAAFVSKYRLPIDEQDRLGDLLDSVPGTTNWRFYAGEMVESHTVRVLQATGARLAEAATAPGVTPHDLVEKAVDWLYDLDRRNRATGSIEDASEIERLVVDGEAQPQTCTGYSSLDYYLRIAPKSYHVLAGTTSSGKSTLAQGIAANICRGGGAVLIVSLEMSPKQVYNRILASESGIFGNKIRDRRMSPIEEQTVRQKANELATWKLRVDSRSETVADITAAAREWKHKHQRLDLLIVDYLQLLTGDGESRYDVYTKISRQLKILSSTMDIPILALAQLRRPTEGGKTKWRPTVTSLKESGSIENDADSVLLLFRPSDDDPMPAQANEVWLSVAKQRDGSTCGWPDQQAGGIILDWTPALTRFDNKV